MQSNDSIDSGSAPVSSDAISAGTAPAATKPRWDPKGKRNMIIIGGVVLVAVFLLLLLFAGGKEPKEQKKASMVVEAPADQPVVSGMLSEADRAALKQQENARIAEALRGGQSVVVSQVDSGAGAPAPIHVPAVQGNPNGGFTQQGETRLDQAVPPLSQAQAAPPAPDEKKLTALEKQMDTMMRAWGMSGNDGGQRSYSTYVREAAKNNANAGVQTGQQSAGKAQRAADDLMVVRAHAEPYAAEMISEADSDTPGKVRARILSGPLTGAVVQGATRRIGDKGFQLDFSAASYNGRKFQISAYGMDARAPGDVVRGEYDGRYMQRYVFPVISEGVKAYAGARAQTGTQVIAIGIPGVGGAGTVTGAQQTPAPTAEQARNAMFSSGADQVSRALATGPKEGHVQLAAGTQFGIVFEESVYQSDLAGQSGK